MGNMTTALWTLSWILYYCNYYYFAPGRGAKYWDQRDCMSVCLSVHSHNSKCIRRNFTKLSIGTCCRPCPWLGSPLTAIQCYVLPVFLDDVMFPHNGTNGSVSKTTCFIQLARWRQRGRRLPSPTACCYYYFCCYYQYANQSACRLYIMKPWRPYQLSSSAFILQD